MLSPFLFAYCAKLLRTYLLFKKIYFGAGNTELHPSYTNLKAYFIATKC